MEHKLPDYQSWAYAPDGKTKIRSAAWDISMLITRHKDDCAVLADLRRTAGQHVMGAVQRLESAQKTACTCGSAERREMVLDTKGVTSPNT